MVTWETLSSVVEHRHKVKQQRCRHLASGSFSPLSDRKYTERRLLLLDNIKDYACYCH
jgi:hypothetical protein